MGTKEDLLKKQQTDYEYISSRDEQFRNENKYNVNAYGGKAETDELIKRYEQVTTLTEEEIQTIRDNVPAGPEFTVLNQTDYQKQFFITRWKYDGKVKSYNKARKAHFQKANSKEKGAKGIAKYIKLRRKLDKLVDAAKEVDEYRKEENGGYYKTIAANSEDIKAEYDKMSNDTRYQEIEDSVSKKDWDRVKDNEGFVEGIKSYTGMGFRSINSTLRKDKPITEKTESGRHIMAMDKVFEKNKLNRDIVVRRGVGENSFNIFADMLGLKFNDTNDLRKQVRDMIDKKKKTGESIIISDKAYLSTSLPNSGAKFPAGGMVGNRPGVEFVILVRKGTKAINVSHLSGFKNEKELLLNRGTRLRVIDAKMDENNKPICGRNGSWTIYLETVPSAEEGIKREAA